MKTAVVTVVITTVVVSKNQLVRCASAAVPNAAKAVFYTSIFTEFPVGKARRGLPRRELVPLAIDPLSSKS